MAITNPLADFISSADAFLTDGKLSALRITKNKSGRYRFFDEGCSLCQRITGLFWPSMRPHENQTLASLKSIIGHRRLKRIFFKKELQLDPCLLKDNRLVLTRELVHKILIGLADVRLEDLQELAKKKCKSLSKMATAEIDALYAELMPYTIIANPLLRHCQAVKYFDKVSTSGQGFSGLQERVWTILQAKDGVVNGIHATPMHAKMADVEMLTSRLADREPPPGTVMRLHDGYFVVERIFAKGGAHVSVLAEISAPVPRTLLLCRGTATRFNANNGYLSTFNDCLMEIGSLGIKRIWPEIRDYLKEKCIAQVELLGKSLGGAHAQYLTVLIGGTTSTAVNRLTTCCSVGVPVEIQEIFARDVVKHMGRKPEILILRNAGDPQRYEVDDIPAVGGPHLHTRDTTKIYQLVPQSSSALEAQIESRGLVRQVFDLFQSLRHAHQRQTTLKAFHVNEVEDILQEVNMGTRLETVRKFAAVIFDQLTFGWVNGQSFESFYQAAGASVLL